MRGPLVGMAVALVILLASRTVWDKMAIEVILPRDRAGTKDVYLMRVMGCSA